MSSSLALLKGHYRSIRQHWFRIGTLLILDAFGAAFEMIPPLFSVLIFDYALPLQKLSLLLLALAGGFTAFLLYFAVSSTVEYFNLRLDQNLTGSLASELFHKVAQSPLQFYQRWRSGDLTVRLTDDTDVITGLLVNLPAHLVIASVQLIIFFVIAIIMDPWVTLLGLAALPLYFWETYFYSKRLEVTQEDVQMRDSDLYDGLHEKITNVRTIKAFNRQAYEKQRLLDLFEHRTHSNMRHKLVGIYNTFANSITLQIWTAVITFYLGYEVIRGALTIGEMISLGIYLPMIQDPVSNLARVWTQVRMGAVSLRRIEELETLPGEGFSEDSSGEASKKIFAGDIEIRDLSFAYDDGPLILDHIDMTIANRQMTAIVGPSGIGKSTLLHLLLRFYRPTSGEITLGGRAITQLDIRQLRREVGVVFQEISLFSGTVRDNLRYGRPDASDEEVQTAARQANAEAFILNLENGYNTELKPGGINLSGGQRQRLALARALVLQPSILLLDELTSALDAESAFLIEEALEKLRRTMTLILITHQLSTTKKADKIFFLKDGHIIEEGTFQELIDRKGPFFDLYNIQMGGFQEFRRRLEIELERHHRYGEELSLIVLRPRNFPRWKADEESQTISLLMEALTQSIRRELRVMDFCSVYAEDHIAIALPQTNRSKADILVQRLNEKIAKHVFTIKEKAFQTGFEFGIADCSPKEWNYSEQLFARAEQNMK